MQRSKHWSATSTNLSAKSYTESSSSTYDNLGELLTSSGTTEIEVLNVMHDDITKDTSQRIMPQGVSLGGVACGPVPAFW
ncbi:hypothetical protein GN958_ATG12148 [Phytophthora infestans]|uniref:Uncharacterized protein n=1 Tax=Phytophthora infestans TaxID=4787 RepID=A0A8S9UDQ7_PHYIN|nr:hypothetical protein GN958_ATG12148 [Phytophthora infestans]